MIVELERIGTYVVRVDNDGALSAHRSACERAQDTHHGAVPQPRATIDRVLRGNGFFDNTALPFGRAQQPTEARTEAAAQGRIAWRLTYWDPQGTARSITVDDGDPAAQRLIPKLLEALDLPGFPAA